RRGTWLPDSNRAIIEHVPYFRRCYRKASSAVVSLHKVSMTRRVSARAHAHSHGNLGENPAPFKLQLTGLRQTLVVIGWCWHHESLRFITSQHQPEAIQ